MPKTQQDFLEEARRDIPEVSVEEVEARRKRGDDFILLDVREKDEVRAGYIEGAVTIPRGFLEFQAAGQLPNTDKDVVVYCAGGARSLLAAKVLRSMGYDRVSSMAGGITRWRDAGYAVVRDRQLSAEQLERYSRHFLLSQIGEKGQGKLLDAKVLLVGAGGLGSPSGLYLAAAGIGTLGIVDADVVDLSNLQRQILHNTDRIGVSKAESAKQTINALNPDVQVCVYNERLTVDNVMAIFQDYDIIVDGCDNFPTRYLSTMPLSSRASRWCMAAFSNLKDRPVCLSRMLARATAACSPHHPRRAWCRREVKPASWEFCPGSLA